jgi:hypothetical protein
MRTRSQTKTLRFADAEEPEQKNNCDVRGCNKAKRNGCEVADPKIVALVKNSVIDFDEASRLWMANKKKMTNGCYKYVCGAPCDTNNSTFCKKNACKNSIYCSGHKNL